MARTGLWTGTALGILAIVVKVQGLLRCSHLGKGRKGCLVKRLEALHPDGGACTLLVVQEVKMEIPVRLSMHQSQNSIQAVALEHEPTTEAFRPVSHSLAFGLALLAVVLRLWFWYYTNRTWEDALITLQHAENAARGFGLTHDAGGVRVHGFTSPISVLIPLLGEVLHRGFGLTFQKLVSAVSGGVSVFLGVRIAQRLRLANPLVLLVGGYLTIEHQQVLFGMAGMETQEVVMILLFSIYTLFDLRATYVGIGLGLCMLARPDFLFWVAIVIALLVWRCRREHLFHPIGIAVCAFAAVYGPWVAFTTWYYGSPVPNTIWAKEFGYPNRWFADLSPWALLVTLFRRIRGQVFGGLGPGYAGNGTGFQLFDHGVICLIMLLFLLPCLWTVWRTKDLPSIGILGFVSVYALYYLFLMGFVFGWYTVPLAAATILASAIGINTLLNVILDERLRRRVGYGFAVGYLACLAAILPATFRGDRNVQEYVETEVRKPIGLYLGSVMGPQQTVGCESLGYFGYYSRRMVYDYPGLANPAVVKFIRQNPGKRTLIDILAHFRPDYLVLRPKEYADGLKNNSLSLRTDYETVRDYRVPDQRVRELLFPASNPDLEFLVLRRKQ